MTHPTAVPLIIAAHGTRDAAGQAATRQLLELVRRRVAPAPAELGFVEIDSPDIATALRSSLAGQGEAPRAVVVPLMLGTGGHVRSDIPQAIAEGADQSPGTDVRYARYLGHDPRLLATLAERISQATTGWDARDVSVVLVGRGAAVPEANADHARLARMMFELTRHARVVPAYAQVTRPGLPEVLNEMVALSGPDARIVVAANLLFEGRLSAWTREQVAAWQERHPDAEVRIADVIGPVDALADVVVDRYREALEEAPDEEGSPAYLAGLLLAGRRVAVVGAGAVATRRIPRLLEAGAAVHVTSPTLSVRLKRLVDEGRITWTPRPFTEEVLDDVWYVLAATNDPEVNREVTEACQRRRLFCVRADDARAGSSWTPATERLGGVSVGVLGNRTPGLSVRVRAAVVAELLGGGR